MPLLADYPPANATSSHDAAAQRYARNIGQAALTLLSALFAMPPRQAEVPVTTMRGKPGDDLSLYRQYCMASPYDAVMPHLADELRCMTVRV
ncbi:MAG TPA: hypothetical protein VF427_15570 [Noviherbaspirillum sp.]